MQDIVAYFAVNGVPALNLSPIIRIHVLLSGSPNSSLVIDGDAMSEIGDGYYKYIFASYNPREEYVFRADGGSSLPTTNRYAIGATESPDPEENADATWNSAADDFPVGSPITMGAQLNLGTQNTIDILTLEELLLAAQYNRTFLDKNAATLTIYASDKVTPIRIFSLRDSNGVPSITEIVDRLPISGSPLT